VHCFDGREWVSGGADADVGEVRINAGYGADDVVYSLMADLDTSRLISIELGENDDTFAAYLSSCEWQPPSVPLGLDGHRVCSGNDLLAGSNLDLRVRGGNGRDTVNVLADRDVHIYRNAILSLSLAGEGGNDTIGVYYNGELDGMFGFVADGGINDDTVTAHVVVGADSTGILGDPIRSQVRDGGGHDTLTYLLGDNSRGAALLFAGMEFTDWGFGDEANFTPNVRVIW
jgi:hypothetical protein